MKAFLLRNIKAIFFPLLFAFMEVSFHIWHYGHIDLYILFGVLSAISFGFLASALTGSGSRIANKIIAWIFTIITCLFFGLQMVYGHIFTKFISLRSVMENAGDATEFWEQALHGIIECIPGLIFVLVIPVTVLAVFIRKKFICEPDKEKSFIPYLLINLGVSVFFFIVTVLLLPVGGKENFSAYDLYHNDFMLDLGIERLGVITGTRKDIYDFLFGDEQEIDIIETGNLSSLVIEPTGISKTPEPTPTAFIEPTQKPVVTDMVEDGTEVTAEPTESEPSPSPSPTPTPIDTSPNVLNIDFEELAENESKSEIKAI